MSRTDGFSATASSSIARTAASGTYGTRGITFV
jgi:hypothetical protein